MTQDFNHRISIVVNTALPGWQALNTVAHIAAYFGQQLGEQLTTGAYFETQDGVRYPRNSQYAIIVLGAKPDQLPALASRVREAEGVQGMYFIREMIETTNDAEIVDWLAQKQEDQVELLGVGLYGDNDQLRKLTKQLRLWA